jgi:hypothetical protein
MMLEQGNIHHHHLNLLPVQGSTDFVNCQQSSIDYLRWLAMLGESGADGGFRNGWLSYPGCSIEEEGLSSGGIEE